MIYCSSRIIYDDIGFIMFAMWNFLNVIISIKKKIFTHMWKKHHYGKQALWKLENNDNVVVLFGRPQVFGDVQATKLNSDDENEQ